MKREGRVGRRGVGVAAVKKDWVCEQRRDVGNPRMEGGVSRKRRLNEILKSE